MNNELYHHGILGMRWGIRRTKSQLGYKTGNSKKGQADDSDVETKTASSGKSGGSKQSKSISNMTDDELRDHINRMQMERQYLDLQKQISSYTPQQISKGKRFMKSMEKDVITPALKDAGKNLLTKFLNKKGAELLGLDEKKTKDSMEELKKEVMGLNLKKQKIELNKYFEEQNNKNKSESKKVSEESTKSNSSDKTQKPESSSKEPFSEKVKSSFEKNVSTGSYKDNSSKSDKEKVYTGEVYGEGTSKYNHSSSKNSTVIDADFADITINSAANSNTRQIGQNYIAGLLEDKHRK